MSEEIEEVFEPVELVLDLPAQGISSVTLTADPAQLGYYVFDTPGQNAMTALPQTEATVNNAGADIRAALEAAHSIDGIKEQKLQEIAAACRAEYTSTLETTFGAPFHTTEEAILDVMNIISMLAPEATYPDYKGADDVWRDLTREQFQAALQEGAARKSAAFAKRKTLTDQIEAATTKTELEAITW